MGARRRRRRVRGSRQLIGEALLLVCFAALVALVWTTAPGRFDTYTGAGRKLTMEQARAVNASVPFAEQPVLSARPFYFKRAPAERRQSIRCLATAAVYEAGADERGQKAVIQVILNRTRLPQYPNTICGVVYQGASRKTGCQFSFACDGSRTRRPERVGWNSARTAAARAIAGYVFKPVGRATHYHTDWIVPYWMPSLDKIAQVRSHIFYEPRRT